MPKKDYNKRMKSYSLKKEKTKGFVVKEVKIEEILDESGEVNESTIIKISFEGILLHLSVSAAFRLYRDLRTILET